MERSCINNASYSLKAISSLHLSPIGSFIMAIVLSAQERQITPMAIQQTNWHLLVSANL